MKRALLLGGMLFVSLIILFSGCSKDKPEPIIPTEEKNGIVILVQDETAIDSSEQELADALESDTIAYSLVSVSDVIANPSILDTISAIVVAPGYYPTSMDTPIVIGAINSAVESGAGLYLLRKGYFLLSYLGLAEITEGGYYPLVNDESYWVDKVSVSPFSGMPIWNPASTPNDTSYRLTRVDVTYTSYPNPGISSYINTDTLTLKYVLICSTVGWPHQSHGAIEDSLAGVYGTVNTSERTIRIVGLMQFSLGEGKVLLGHSNCNGVKIYNLGKKLIGKCVRYVAG